ncbi:hypothetical protein [Okeania sp.]|uniref:hypothetical protein n=1 Tax=Okeania sp. TaxID=3100323 RepID=UPI002B4ABCBD|nr:hypothetical protein [Okeania sp.]MEB3341108.1 hypothetical protein [Okeania sp.]
MKNTNFQSILLSLGVILLPLTVSNLVLANISAQGLKTTLNRTLSGTYDEGTWGGKGSNETWNHSWTMVGDTVVQLSNIKEVDGEFTANLKIAWKCKHTREDYNFAGIRKGKYDDRYSGHVTAEVAVGSIAGQSKIFVNNINNTYPNFRCGNSLVNKLKKLNQSEL